MSPPLTQIRREQGSASAVHLRRISGRTTFLLVALVGFLVHILQWALLPFVIAGLTAYVGSAAVDWLQPRIRLPRWAVALAGFLLVLALAAVAAWAAIPPLLGALPHLAEHIKALTQILAKAALGNRTVSVFGQSMNADGLANAAMSGLRNFMDRATVLAPLGGFVFAGLFGIPLTLILFAYFLFGGATVGRGLFALVPPKDRPVAHKVWRRLDPVIKRYFLGVLAVVVYAATAAYIGLGLVLHAPYAVTLAVATGVLEIVPLVGPAASAVIAGLVMVAHAKGMGPIIGYALYATALRLSIDQWFGPLALGASSRLHPTMIMFCFLVGAALFGVAGVILAVPAALATKTTLAVLYEEPAGDDAG